MMAPHMVQLNRMMNMSKQEELSKAYILIHTAYTATPILTNAITRLIIHTGFI